MNIGNAWAHSCHQQHNKNMSKNAPVLTGRPDAEMTDVLDFLTREDADQPDPTLLGAEEGRALAVRNSLRWNRELPAVESTHELSFPCIVPDLDGGVPEHAIDALLITPAEAEPGLILYIHGGGFAFCNIQTHERFARQLAIASRCSVLSVDYRLAPEHPFPAGLNDCISVFRQLDTLHEEFPLTKGPVAVSGDSAGANLALALILHEQEEDRTAPDFGLMFYGVFGADFETTSYRQFENGPGLTRGKMIRYIDWYATAEQQTQALVAPNVASDAQLQRLPPLYFNAAEIDPLCSDTLTLVERLRGLGRQDEFDLYPGVVHGFLQMSLRLPAASQATAATGAAFQHFVRDLRN